MIDIDKKIEKMKKGQPVVDTQGHFMYYVENTTEIKWLIDRLKECREELRQRDIAAKDGP